MAIVKIEVIPDEGFDLTYNRTVGCCSGNQRDGGPVWAVSTTIAVPQRVAKGGIEQIKTFLIRELKTAGSAVQFEIQIKERETIDRVFAPEWIYSDSINTDQLASIFRKRGHGDDIITIDQHCGDETREEFLSIAIPGEELITSDMMGLIPPFAWRIRRPLVAGMRLLHRNPKEKLEMEIQILDAKYDGWFPLGPCAGRISYIVTMGISAGSERTISNIEEFDYYKVRNMA